MRPYKNILTRENFTGRPRENFTGTLRKTGFYPVKISLVLRPFPRENFTGYYKYHCIQRGLACMTLPGKITQRAPVRKRAPCPGRAHRRAHGQNAGPGDTNARRNNKNAYRGHYRRDMRHKKRKRVW